MSGRRSELVHAAVAALNRGDWDAGLAVTAPDFEYDMTRTPSPLAGVYRGQTEMRRVVEEFLGSWETVRYEPREVVEAGDQVVVPFTTHFHGRQGIAMAVEAAWIWTFRGDQVTRIRLYQHADEALADAGIERSAHGG